MWHTIVQLGRYGDILNLLPLVKHLVDSEGWRIRWVVGQEFRDVLEGIPWIEEKISVPSYSLADGVRVAEQLGEGGVQHITQIYQNPVRKYLEKKYANFQRAQWALLKPKYADRLYEFPLDLPVAKHYSSETRIVHHVRGVTAPEYVGKLPGQPLALCTRFLDLSIQLAHSSCFFGIDSGPLFLAEAVGVPTVGLIPRTGWTAREPHPSWIAWAYY
jgi:hypothetical protein